MRFNSPFAFDPLHTGCANHSHIEQRLGAAKKKKRARRTEGRAGLSVGAQRHEGARTALRHLAIRTLRHETCRRSARGNFTIPELQANQRKIHRFSLRLRGFTLILWGGAIAVVR
jgi:hypothetical protein